MRLSDVLLLKERIEYLQQKIDRAKGALDAHISRLRDSFGCKSVKEARLLLKALGRDKQAAEAEAEKAFSDFEKRWADDLK